MSGHSAVVAAAAPAKRRRDPAAADGLSGATTRDYPRSMRRRLYLMRHGAVAYFDDAGRPVAATTAVGYMSKHVARQQQLIEDAFGPRLSEGEMLVRT